MYCNFLANILIPIFNLIFRLLSQRSLPPFVNFFLLIHIVHIAQLGDHWIIWNDQNPTIHHSQMYVHLLSLPDALRYLFFTVIHNLHTCKFYLRNHFKCICIGNKYSESWNFKISLRATIRKFGANITRIKLSGYIA